LLNLRAINCGCIECPVKVLQRSLIGESSLFDSSSDGAFLPVNRRCAEQFPEKGEVGVASVFGDSHRILKLRCGNWYSQ
jgi:hypothetical protein